MIQIELLSQKRDDLDQKIWEDERNEHRLKLRIEQLEQQSVDPQDLSTSIFLSVSLLHFVSLFLFLSTLTFC